MYPILDNEHGKQRAFVLWTGGNVQIPFDVMMSSPPFSDQEKRLELLRRLNEIEGVALSPDVIDRWPNTPIERLLNEESLAKFMETMEGVVGVIRKSG